MARTEIYVDPSIAGNSGTGTSGDPYGDLEYALAQDHFDTTNGTRINIKAGTAEVLSAALDVLTHFMAGGVTSWSNPGWVIEGYTSTAGDGGIAEVDCNGNKFLSKIDLDAVFVKGIHFHNGSTNTLLQFNNYGGVYNCEFNNAVNGVNIGGYGCVSGCRFYDLSEVAITAGTSSKVDYNYIAGGTKTPSTGIFAQGSHVEHNIISLAGNSWGIYVVSPGTTVRHNSIFSTAGGSGSGRGCTIYNNTYGLVNPVFENNLIEGFYYGIYPHEYGTMTKAYSLLGNSIYNCTSPYATDGAGRWFLEVDEDNETLTASPFTKSGSDTYANRLNYFYPVLAVRRTAFPVGSNLDRGAIQSADPDQASENDVRRFVDYNNNRFEGRLVIPDPSDVKAGVTYGAEDENGREYTGTYSL